LIQSLNWQLRRLHCFPADRANPGSLVLQEEAMPLVDIQLIRGVFTPEQKDTMIRKVTDAMVSIEGEAMRPVTWVRIQEIESGAWAIGGKALSASDVRAMAADHH
jgi:4-oxalocrotonate tautomerase